MNLERKLATIRRIDAINPIPGADAIEVATVGGWKVVVRKGNFNVGSLGVYIEIDSLIPGHMVSKEEDIVRLRTVKLRGQLSQGLLLPLMAVTNYPGVTFSEGDDLTKVLGIEKWERPVNPQLAGIQKGNFPLEIPKTNQERVQNISQYDMEMYRKLTWEVTEKLDGSSATFYLDMNGEFHVCSRNINLKEDETNSFWQAARLQRVEEKMRANQMMGVAIQGELMTVSGKSTVAVFDIFSTRLNQYLDPTTRRYVTEKLELHNVPVLEAHASIKESVEELLLKAEGTSVYHTAGVQREGLVYKCNEHPWLSFKVISNKWLLKNKE